MEGGSTYYGRGVRTMVGVPHYGRGSTYYGRGATLY